MPRRDYQWACGSDTRTRSTVTNLVTMVEQQHQLWALSVQLGPTVLLTPSSVLHRSFKASTIRDGSEAIAPPQAWLYHEQRNMRGNVAPLVYLELFSMQSLFTATK